MEDYEKLLDTLYSQLPEKAVSGERFQMPDIEIIHQGSKTLVRNFNTIISKVRREPQFIMKYLSRELAVPMNTDGSMLIIHGNINDRLLKNKIEAFVKSYVICSVCGRPDTNIVEVEKGARMLVCEACGGRSPIK